MFRWMDPGWPTCSFSTNRAIEDSLQAAQAMRTHIGEVFAEWISHSVHFAVNPVPLVEGWHRVMVASEWCRHRSQVEYPVRLVPNLASSESDSTLPLIGSAPPSAVRTGPVEDTGCGWATRVLPIHQQGRPPQGPTHKGGCWKLTSLLSR